MMDRRQFLKNLFVAPAIVQASSLMPIKVLAEPLRGFFIDPVTKQIKHGGDSTAYNTVLDFYRWLRDEFDKPEMLCEQAPLGITRDLIHLQGGWNISGEAATRIHDGTIKNSDGSIYSAWSDDGLNIHGHAGKKVSRLYTEASHRTYDPLEDRKHATSLDGMNIHTNWSTRSVSYDNGQSPSIPIGAKNIKKVNNWDSQVEKRVGFLGRNMTTWTWEEPNNELKIASQDEFIFNGTKYK